MSSGKTSEADFQIVLSGIIETSSLKTQFAVLTSDGWNDSLVKENQLLQNLTFYDHLITKDGLLFVTGGIYINDSQNFSKAALTYNFTSMEWKKLKSMLIPRFWHKCQSISHDLKKSRFSF